MRSIPAGEFKAKCLAILDEVNSTGEPVLVTKRGKPVARVDVPFQAESNSADSIFGCLSHMATIAEGADLITSDFDEKEWLKNWDRVERENQ
jgi:antitoxin (DNA-binding transcriptional repressor) of toxin-antitoxin stability system